MTAFFVSFLVALIGLILACYKPNTKRQEFGLITFGMGLFFMLYYFPAVVARMGW